MAGAQTSEAALVKLGWRCWWSFKSKFPIAGCMMYYWCIASRLLKIKCDEITINCQWDVLAPYSWRVWSEVELLLKMLAMLRWMPSWKAFWRTFPLWLALSWSMQMESLRSGLGPSHPDMVRYGQMKVWNCEAGSWKGGRDVAWRGYLIWNDAWGIFSKVIESFILRCFACFLGIICLTWPINRFTYILIRLHLFMHVYDERTLAWYIHI